MWTTVGTSAGGRWRQQPAHARFQKYGRISRIDGPLLSPLFAIKTYKIICGLNNMASCIHFSQSLDVNFYCKTQNFIVPNMRRLTVKFCPATSGSITSALLFSMRSAVCECSNILCVTVWQSLVVCDVNIDTVSRHPNNLLLCLIHR